MTPSTLRELVVSVVALAVAFLVWRLGYAVTDRFFGRRFISRFIPRVATFCQLTKSIISFVIVVALVLVLLNIWDVNVAPAVWSAGIVTAALAFGAQTVVRDILAGFSGLLEDQFDVGDSVELTTTVNSVITGTVEGVGLRSTRIIDERGRHIFVPNGNILYTANASRTANRIGFSIALPLRAQIGEMRAKLQELANAAAKAAGVSDDEVTVAVTDIGAENATFATEFRAPRAETQAKLSALRERLGAELQALGWLPGKPAS